MIKKDSYVVLSFNNKPRENFHPQYKTHYNTLKEFLKFESQSITMLTIMIGLLPD